MCAHPHAHTDKHTHMHTPAHTRTKPARMQQCIWASKQAGKQASKQTNRQASRQASMHSSIKARTQERKQVRASTHGHACEHVYKRTFPTNHNIQAPILGSALLAVACGAALTEGIPRDTCVRMCTNDYRHMRAHPHACTHVQQGQGRGDDSTM